MICLSFSIKTERVKCVVFECLKGGGGSRSDKGSEDPRGLVDQEAHGCSWHRWVQDMLESTKRWGGAQGVYNLTTDLSQQVKFFHSFILFGREFRFRLISLRN